MKPVNSFLTKQFWLLLAAVALFFFLLVASGVTWGLPAIWNIDERLHQVIPVLSGGLNSLPEDFSYPTLPLFIMLAAGKIFSLLTAAEVAILAGVRAISASLAALVIILTALSALAAGKSRPTALLAAILVPLSSGFATIAHYAQVDISLAFFVTLATFLLLQFVASRREIWLYLGFLAIGLAASSKYNGASLLLGATLIAILFEQSSWRTRFVPNLGRMLLAYGLAVLGFLIGTPQAVPNARSYLEQLLPFLQRQREYAGPRDLGIVGQWGNTVDGLGLLLFLLFLLATIWALFQAVKYVLARVKQRNTEQSGPFILAILLILFAFELPIAISQFYPIRYMVPAVPLLALLSSWMINELWRSLQKSGHKTGQRLLFVGLLAVIFFSALRIMSVTLYFANDGRIAAAAYLQEVIAPGTRTEYTSYPPQLPSDERVVDKYPLVVFKFEEDITPHTGANMGEEGIEIRKPDYLVIDRKTFGRFEDEHVCRLNPVECHFFARLLNEETNYRLIRRFEYRVPPYLPQVRMDFVNIDVLVFERKEQPAASPLNNAWQQQINARLGENILLQGYTIEEMAGNQLNATLFWSTSARLAENYKVFVHCLDQDGHVAAQSDNIPADGSSPTEYWMRNEIIQDEHILQLPQAMSAANCRLQAGLYAPETAERLPAHLGARLIKEGAVSLPSN